MDDGVVCHAESHFKVRAILCCAEHA
jgi:hypothetical protein